MSEEKNLLKSLELLKDIGVKNDSITAIKHIAAQEGRFREYPPKVHPDLVSALNEKGFTKLYTHQNLSYELLKEGKNRQIRRMVGKVGNQVTQLKRIRISNIKIGTLAEGAWRHLTKKEKDTILNIV